MPERPIDPVEPFPGAACWQMTYVDYVAMVQMRKQGLALMPALAVLVLGWGS